MNDALEMWDYWRDRCGLEEALRQHYSDLLASDPVLNVAAAQIDIAKRAIDSRMRELEEREMQVERQSR